MIKRQQARKGRERRGGRTTIKHTQRQNMQKSVNRKKKKKKNNNYGQSWAEVEAEAEAEVVPVVASVWVRMCVFVPIPTCRRQIVNLNEMLNQYSNAQKVGKCNETESGSSRNMRDVKEKSKRKSRMEQLLIIAKGTTRQQYESVCVCGRGGCIHSYGKMADRAGIEITLVELPRHGQWTCRALSTPLDIVLDVICTDIWALPRCKQHSQFTIGMDKATEKDTDKARERERERDRRRRKRGSSAQAKECVCHTELLWGELTECCVSVAAWRLAMMMDTL